jgi:HTH-type transcriptional regulator, competence development regulator
MTTDKYQKQMVKFGQRMRKIRKHRSLTLLDLESETNIPNGRLSKIENGLVNVEFITVARIAEALGVEIMELYNYVGPLPSNR